MDCNFDAKLVSKKRKYRSTNKAEEARLPTVFCLYNSWRPSLANCISTYPECRSDHHLIVYNHSLVLLPRYLLFLSSRVHGLLNNSRQTQPWRQPVHKISRCILTLLCFLPLLCFMSLLSSSIHREKCSNLPPFTGFTQLCTSVSTFTINADNCLFLCNKFPCTFLPWSVLVSPGLQLHHQTHHRLVTVIL